MNTRHLLLTLTGVIVLAAAAPACGKKESTGQQAGAAVTNNTAAVDMTTANTIYQERCSACHGAGGRGDGPGSATLTPKPRNYTDTGGRPR